MKTYKRLSEKIKFNKGLRFRISATLMAIIIVLSMFFGLVLVYNSRLASQEAEKAIVSDLVKGNEILLEGRLDGVSTLIEELFVPFERSIDILASDENLAALSNKDDSNQVYRSRALWTLNTVFENNKDIELLYFQSMDNITTTIPDNIKTDHVDPKSRDWYINALENPDKALWTGPYQDKISQGEVLTISKTVKGPSGNIVGVIGADISLDRIESIIHSSGVGNGGYFVLLDNQGRVFSLPEDKEDYAPPGETFPIKTVVDFVLSNQEVLEPFRYNPNEDKDGISLSAHKFKSIDLSLVSIIPDRETIDQTNFLVNQVFDIFNNKVKDTFLGLIFAIFICLGFLYYYSNQLSSPIEEVTKAVVQVAQGNYNYELPVLYGETELDILIASTERLQKVLSYVVEDISKTTDYLGETSSTINKSMANLKIGFENITTSINEVAQGNNGQTLHMEEASRLIFSMTDKMEEVVDISKSLNDLALNANQVKTRADNTVFELMDTSGDTKDQFTRLLKDIDSLVDTSNLISSSTKIINDINEQTHLLALNAAIEAARAGEQGKGFAVVADEIRNLSENVGEATRDISDSISHMERDMEALLKGINSMENVIRAQNKTSSEVRQAFDNIDRSLGLIMENVGETLESIDIMIQDKNRVVNTFQEVLSTTEEIAAAAEEVAVVAETQTEDVYRIGKITHELEEIHQVLVKDLHDLGYRKK